MDYVLGRVLPPEPGMPRPRFSLYLSSQLQYGVVVVFHRQCGLLLGKSRGAQTTIIAAADAVVPPTWAVSYRGPAVIHVQDDQDECGADDRPGRDEEVRGAGSAQTFAPY